jgi:4-hydroxy-3-methylbut-2-enyl diphosphate reductase
LDIILSRYAGFCPGVARAVSLLREAKRSRKFTDVLGQLIHNENFIKKLEDEGFNFRLSLDEITGKGFVIRAHGISRKILKTAKARGLNFVDATCPVVKQVYDYAIEAEKKGNVVIFFGDPDHPEIMGASDSIRQKSIILRKIKDCDQLKNMSSDEKVTLIAQSTSSYEDFRKISERLKKIFINIEIRDTVCREVIQRQQEVKTIDAEIGIVIGSRHSANTQRLFKAVRNRMPAVLVEDAKDLNKRIVREKNKVFITSGTSTHIEDVELVVGKIKKIIKRSQTKLHPII